MDYTMSKEFGVDWVKMPQGRAMDLYITHAVTISEQNKKQNKNKPNGRY